ncbi:MAG TPA: OB-fold domain-containing protein [Acidimicrobiales bacterium]|nr:OB-fold domain-containing protein [Acidimicrobiales bacterium]
MAVAGGDAAGGTDVLRAPHVLEYPYARSVGPVLGAFFTALRDGRILGVRSGDTVVVPPTEYDPVTGADTGDMVEVGPGGVVTTWAWTTRPLTGQPLERPFAWALVRLDGADTALLHAVDAGSPDAMATGMRVVPRWRPASERQGHIRDIECFVPESSPAGSSDGAAR